MYRYNAAMEAKMERLTAMVANGNGGAGGHGGGSSGGNGGGSSASGGTALLPGVAAPHTPVEGNYSKVFNRAPDGGGLYSHKRS